MKYEFSKLELWLKGVMYDPQFPDEPIARRAYITGYSVIKIFERRWYNPLRWFFAKHGVHNIPSGYFYTDS